MKTLSRHGIPFRSNQNRSFDAGCPANGPLRAPSASRLGGTFTSEGPAAARDGSPTILLCRAHASSRKIVQKRRLNPRITDILASIIRNSASCCGVRCSRRLRDAHFAISGRCSRHSRSTAFTSGSSSPVGQWGTPGIVGRTGRALRALDLENHSSRHSSHGSTIVCEPRARCPTARSRKKTAYRISGATCTPIA